mmetsp:Transcript_10661/g.65755  ORF Transcript_10661/g.65755 Transcript_10661/m.65755 type:complete len:223 (-) Transcript_10661:29-697(-)
MGCYKAHIHLLHLSCSSDSSTRALLSFAWEKGRKIFQHDTIMNRFWFNIPLGNFGSQHHEGIVYTRTRLCTCLHERNADAPSQGHPLRSLHLSGIRHVYLVPNEQLEHVIRCIGFDVSEPLSNVDKGPPVCDTVTADDPTCSPIVGRGDGPEFFLTCRVPDLQLDHFASQIHRLDAEVHPNGIPIRFFELVIGETEEQARLSHCRIADEKELGHLEFAHRAP